MIVYHGSTVPVKIPVIMENERMLDFGVGFYTTSNKEQAIRWSQLVAARRKANTCFISEYEFAFEIAENTLEIVFFNKPDSSWLEFVCQNRLGKTPLQNYDVAMGPVADDQVYATVLLYEQGLLSKEAAVGELKVRKLYNQVLFHTKRSLDYCKYIQHFEIEGTSYGK